MPAGKAPYLIHPNGTRIDLVVDNYVPYISSVLKSNVANPDVSLGVPPPPAMAGEEVDIPIYDPNASSSKDHGPSNHPSETPLPQAEEDDASSGDSSNEDYEEATTPETEKNSVASLAVWRMQ